MVALLKGKMTFLTHVCVPVAVQAQCSCFIILLPISVQKIGALDPFNNRERCLEILDTAGASRLFKQLCSKKTFHK